MTAAMDGIGGGFSHTVTKGKCDYWAGQNAWISLQITGLVH